MTIPADFFSGGVEGVWFKNDIATMWQDTAGTVPCTAAGQTVARWDDQSGRGHHATQATASARPTLRQNANGRWYLELDGGDYLDVSAFQVNDATTRAVSAGSRARTASFTSSPRIISAGGVTAGTLGDLLRYTATNNQAQARLLTNNSTTNVQESTATNSITLNVLNTLSVVASGAGGRVVETWADGTSDGSTTAALDVSNGLSPIRIGAQSAAAPTGFLTGHIYGIIVVASALSSSDRVAMESYLTGLDAAVGGGSTTYTYSGSGGLQSGGSAALAKTKAKTGSGGLQLGGSAILAKVKSSRGTGGASFVGAASTSFQAAGAPSPNTYTYSGTGGLTYGGAALSLIVQASGDEVWTEIPPGPSPFVAQDQPSGTWTIINPTNETWN